MIRWTAGDGLSFFMEEDVPEAVKIAADNLKNDLTSVLSATTDPGTREGADLVIEWSKDRLEPEEYRILEADGRLFIRGSDKRGLIYGIYQLSALLGVSPWYFWADVPVRTLTAFTLPSDFEKASHPSVRWRGIFINDEEELEAFAQTYMKETTIGPKTYTRIFELLLRLGGNYIWPAMHVNAFNADSENGRIASRMGLVVGTSHCDMLLRSNQNEWTPWLQKKQLQGTEYDYSIEGENREQIKTYWRESVLQNKEYEVTYTVGMRGIHDSGFVTRVIEEDPKLSPEEKKEAKVKLLENVIANQRAIIHDVTGRSDTPQIFVPYKEVLDLYDRGLNVPDDITLIWANDNFGYMRRYPNEKEKKRSGGNGLYYHASYWATPGMSWLFYNSIPLAHMKYELQKAYENGIQTLWVLNVGAIKPLEMDISFFLRYAWEIGQEEETTKDAKAFVAHWLSENFGGADTAECAENCRKEEEKKRWEEAADIYTAYIQLANVCKVEHLRMDVFRQGEGAADEASHRMVKLQDCFWRTMRLYERIPKEQKAAFFQVFCMKILAGYYIYASFYFADKSRYLYSSGQMKGADSCCRLMWKMDDYKRALLYYYNHTMSGGKWNRILTPEEFRPPCMALYPAGKPALRISPDTCGEEECGTASDRKEIAGAVAVDAVHFTNAGDWKEIRYLGRGGGSLMEAGSGWIEYAFTTSKDGDYLLELFRFPSLNSTGTIGAEVLFDDRPAQNVYSCSNDEWTGNWKYNVMHNVDRLRLALPGAVKGTHTLKIRGIGRYFAFSKLVVYTDGFVPLNMGPEEIAERATYREDLTALDAAAEMLFGRTDAPLPDVIYADREFWTKNRLFLKNTVVSQEKAGPVRYHHDGAAGKDLIRQIRSSGEGPLQEKDGVIAFGTEYVLEASADFFCTQAPDGLKWEHTLSPSDGRSGLAMQVEPAERFFEDIKDAPAMNYRIHANGGTYRVWMLLKYDDSFESYFSILIDGMEIPQSRMPENGRLFNYGTKQNWVWMYLTETFLPAGDHLFTIAARASQVRIDRVYLSCRTETEANDYPPVDYKWNESGRYTDNKEVDS